jgi:DNA-binding SARP family transcriptional activator/tetratricopeptide (TPR) repeat protein
MVGREYVTEAKLQYPAGGRNSTARPWMRWAALAAGDPCPEPSSRCGRSSMFPKRMVLRVWSITNEQLLSRTASETFDDWLNRRSHCPKTAQRDLPMSTYRFLRCMGQPLLFGANSEPIRFRTKKHLALLTFLAVERAHPHRRDRLAELLWPRAHMAEARHSLATGLSIIRGKVGTDVLDANRDSVTFVARGFELDIERLQNSDMQDDGSRYNLGVAAFLEGFEISDAPEFALWKDRQQARLLPYIKAALITSIDQCRRTGDTGQIEKVADKMLALDELSEDAVRAKMEARAFAGDRLGALKIFEQWKMKLAEDLGASPSTLVEGLAIRLRRRGWERTCRTGIPNVATDQWKGRQFVGRAIEHRTLYEAWELIRGGVPSHILVIGDSGVGKTTLVERFTTATGLEGSVTSRVQCYDLERSIPYAAIGGLIRGLLDAPGISAAPPDSLAALALLIPEMRQRFNTIPVLLDAEGESARIRLTEALQALLLAIADEHPVILVVDDAHLADEASLAVLHLIMRRTRGQHVLVVLVARPGELWNSPEFSRLREGRAQISLREVELQPLNEEETRRLLFGLVSGNLPPEGVSKALIRAAAGFPMVLELLLLDWQTHGYHSLALALEGMTADLKGSASPPEVYPQALKRLARSVDVCTQSVLNLASVLGRRLNEIGLYGIVDLSVGQTMAGMSELLNRRILRDGHKGLEFVNELVRTAAYLAVPSPLRHALHGEIADRLIARATSGSDALGLEIAWHCMRAGRLKEGTVHLMSGARDAIRAGAPQEAEGALTSALPVLEGESLEAASILLVEVLFEQGRSREALDILLRLRSEGSMASGDHVTALFALVGFSLGPSASIGIQEQLPNLERIVREAADPATRVLAGRAMAFAIGESCNHALTPQLIRALDEIPTANLDADSLGQLSLAKGRLLYGLGDAVNAFKQALAGATELRQRHAANVVMVQLEAGLGTIKLAEGAYEGALKHYERAFEMAIRLGNDHQIALAVGNIALCYGRLGDYAQQFMWAEKAPPFASADFAGYIEIQLAYVKAFAMALQNRRSDACAIVEALDNRLVGPVPPWMIQAWAMWKADLLLICGERTLATANARQALVDSEYRLLKSSFAGPFSRWLTLAAQAPIEKERARHILREMVHQFSSYDSLDQLEVLCSLYKLTGVDTALGESITERLACLPAAIRGQLVLLEQLS